MASVLMGWRSDLVNDVTISREKQVQVKNHRSLPEELSLSYQFAAGLLKQLPQRHNTNLRNSRPRLSGSFNHPPPRNKASKIIFFPPAHVDLTMTREAEKFHLYYGPPFHVFHPVLVFAVAKQKSEFNEINRDSIEMYRKRRRVEGGGGVKSLHALSDNDETFLLPSSRFLFALSLAFALHTSNG